MTVRDSTPFVAWGFQPMIEGDDRQRRVRFGNTNFRQLDNLLNLPPGNARFGKLVFPHLTRRRTRGSPGHGLSSTLRLSSSLSLRAEGRREGEGRAT